MQHGPIALCALSVFSSARRSSTGAPRKMEKSVSTDRARGAVDGEVQPRTRRRDCSRRAIAESGAKNDQNGKILGATSITHSGAMIDPHVNPRLPLAGSPDPSIFFFSPYPLAFYKFQPPNFDTLFRHNGVYRSSVHGDQAEVDFLHRLRWHNYS